MAKHRELKGLETRLAKCREQIALHADRIGELRQEQAVCRGREEGLLSKIAVLKKSAKGLVITEHAMLRYIERVMGVSMDKLQEKVLPDTLRDKAALFGNTTFPVNGHSVTIRDGAVVTVIKAP